MKKTSEPAKNNNKTIELTVSDHTPFYMGMSVYRVGLETYGYSYMDSRLRAEFREPCTVCNGTGKVELKGRSYTCPECKGSKWGASDSIIKLYDFTVTEYVIHSVNIKGVTFKTPYKNGDYLLKDRYRPSVVWSGFCKAGRSSDAYVREFRYFNEYVLNVSENSIGCDTNDVFLTKGEAEEFCRQLHDIQRGKLKKFNEIHGTHYEYPFDNGR